MKCEVRCFAGLDPKHIVDNIFEFEQNLTALELMQAIEINPDDVRLIFINGTHGELDSIIKDQDRVGLFPPIGGG